MIAGRHHMIFIKILSSGNTQQTHNQANNKRTDDLKTTAGKHTQSIGHTKTHTHAHSVNKANNSPTNTRLTTEQQLHFLQLKR